MFNTTERTSTLELLSSEGGISTAGKGCGILLYNKPALNDSKATRFQEGEIPATL